MIDCYRCGEPHFDRADRIEGWDHPYCPQCEEIIFGEDN